MNPVSRISVMLFSVASLVAAGNAYAQGAAPSDVRIERVGEVLLVFLVLSAVFEVALTPIFNWRVFLKHLEGKGWKTPITVGAALLVFWGFDLDVVKDLLVALGYAAKQTFGGQLLTAFLIAGGSDGILKIFTKLGIRDPKERDRRIAEVRRS